MTPAVVLTHHPRRPAHTLHTCSSALPAPANADVLAVHRVLSEVRVDCLCPESAVPSTAASIRRATEEANGDELLTSSSSSLGPCIRPAVDDLLCVRIIPSVLRAGVAGPWRRLNRAAKRRLLIAAAAANHRPLGSFSTRHPCW